MLVVSIEAIQSDGSLNNLVPPKLPNRYCTSNTPPANTVSSKTNVSSRSKIRDNHGVKKYREYER